MTPFAIYQQSSGVIEPDMNIVTCFTCEETLMSLNLGNFAEFCMAVSFTLVDLKFAVQESFSLTLCH